MKKISITIYLLFCSFFVFGQNSPVWQTYSSPKDEFIVEIPTEFETDYRTIDDVKNNKIYTSARYSLVNQATSYYIFSQVIDKENNKPNEIPASELKVFIANNSAKSITTKIGKFTGEQFSFKDTEEFFHKIIFIQTAKRFYIFHTFSQNEVNADSDRFFASIKFREIEDSPFTKPSATVIAEKSKTKPIADSGGGQGSGQGAGSGSGGGRNGNGSSSTTPTQSQILEKQTSPLKLLSRPRASYTDLARIYTITGSVLLRVTFLANGNIGATSPISKLPFGLTNSAMNAAKQIRFEPAMKDGIPYNVVKQVQYIFTLY